MKYTCVYCGTVYVGEKHVHVCPPAPGPKRLLSTLTSAQRKEYPLLTGLFQYFPDALAMVAHISYVCNEKHNPGQPMHWGEGKSMDQGDAMLRHTTESGEFDDDGELHSAKQAWRALAVLQLELEARYNLSPPPARKKLP